MYAQMFPTTVGGFLQSSTLDEPVRCELAEPADLSGTGCERRACLIGA